MLSDTDGAVSSIFPPEFLAETKDRGKLASWCPQDQILKHPAIGVFDNLTLEELVVEFHLFVGHFSRSSKPTVGLLATNGVSAWR
jgi:hypothetical protein